MNWKKKIKSLKKYWSNWNEWWEDHPGLAILFFGIIIMISTYAMAYIDKIYYFLWFGINIYSCYQMVKIVMGVAPTFRD